jgi:zinc dependent phospholipase C
VKLCALLVLLYAPDANAWGLQTHVFLAHYALAAVPLTDPEWRVAAQGLPRMVLAGACLPDLAIVGRFFLHSPAFRRSHLWATLRRIAASPGSDYDRALALGYATHLLSDVVAHNEFVPEHEARIGRTAMIGHLVSEWAMDDWLRQKLLPADALEEAGEHAVQFVARAFRCNEAFARRALGVLMWGDRVLRASPAPAICRTALGLVVPLLEKHFGLYLARTTRVLGAVETALAGGFEDWSGLDPEGGQGDGSADRRPGEHIARIVQAEHHARGRGEHRERDQGDRKIGVVRAGHERERDRVKRVA